MCAPPLDVDAAHVHFDGCNTGVIMYPNILVPIDGSEASACGLAEAIKIAKQQGSKLRLLHIVKEPVLDVGYEYGVCRADVILDEARQWPASLIVMGSHARHGFLRVGSDTAQVLADTPVPVIFVRGAVAPANPSEHRPLHYASAV